MELWRHPFWTTWLPFLTSWPLFQRVLLLPLACMCQSCLRPSCHFLCCQVASHSRNFLNSQTSKIVTQLQSFLLLFDFQCFEKSYTITRLHLNVKIPVDAEGRGSPATAHPCGWISKKHPHLAFQELERAQAGHWEPRTWPLHDLDCVLWGTEVLKFCGVFCC